MSKQTKEQERQVEMCATHPNNVATKHCQHCGKHMCKECSVHGIFSQPADGTIYVCKKCYDQC